MQLVPSHSGEVNADNFVQHFEATQAALLSLWAHLEDEKRKALTEERKLAIPPEVQKKLGEALTAMELIQPVVSALV